MSDIYDALIIGAGPGGYVCAIRAAQFGLRTAIVDKEWLGGVCLNVGCIPSKALLRNAEIVALLQGSTKEFGFACENLRLDYAAAVRRSRRVAARLAKGVEFLLKKNGVDFYRGTAVLRGVETIEILEAADGVPQILRARNIVIATGARPALPPGLTADGRRVLTYRQAILQESLPAAVVIVGGGPIGLEFATLWNSYGVKVTVVEMMPTLAPGEDEEISTELARQFAKNGITVHTGARVESIATTDDGVQVSIDGPAGDEIMAADQALVAVGFRPNSDEVGLETIGLSTDRRFIPVDQQLRTPVRGVWAVGDVTGKLMLAHAASAQGLVCAAALAGRPVAALDYDAMPRTIYSRPQIASFGLTEKQARDQDHAIRVARFPFSANGKALGLGDYVGFVKLISEAASGELLGAHLIGPEVTELLPELTLARRAKLTAADIAANIHAHPTLSEVLMEAAYGLTGDYLHL